MKQLCDLLHIGPGITAVIGSGGKTSLLATLAEELDGRVILATSTHIFPFEGIPTADPCSLEQARRLLDRGRIVCCAAPCEDGKLGVPSLSFEALAACADYVLVEADGSRQLPLKAHAAHEPALPAEAGAPVLVAGASGFGKPICDVVHRPELFCRLAEIDPDAVGLDDVATPERVARVVLSEHLAQSIFLNQVDDEHALGQAQAFCAALGRPVVVGSLAQRRYRLM